MATTIPIIKQNGTVITECYLGSSITIELSNDNVNYDHDIYYGLAGETFELATFVGNSYTWEIPLSLCELLPNTTEGRFTVRVETYEGYTLIGTKNAVITVKVPESITPAVTDVTYSEAISGIDYTFGGFVQDNSRIDVNVNASGQYGASIIQCITEFMGKTYTGTSFTTDVVIESGTHPIKTVITDSRGRTLEVNNSIIILPYTYPIGSVKAYRSTSDGTKSDEGEYVTVDFDYTVDVMNNNVASYAVKYSIAGEDSWTTLISDSVTSTAYGEIFTSDKAVVLGEYPYTIRLTVSDYFRTVDIDVDIPVGFMLMDFSDNGRAIGVGKASEKDIGIEFNIPIYDQYDTRILNGLAYYESGGSTDADTTIEELFLSTVNTPTSNFWFVRQVFYAGKTSTSNRVQYATPYNKPYAGDYRRTYNGSWSEWVKIPVIVEEGTSGIWTYRKWSNGKAEAFGKVPISSLAVTTALGGWYRSAVVSGSGYSYPFTFSGIPNVNTDYLTSNGTGGMVWLTTQGGTSYPPDFYIIRPTSSSGVTGTVNIQVEGTWSI